MVQQVNVNGEIHEFPDEATPQMMEEALRKYTAQQQFMEMTKGPLDRLNETVFEKPLKKLGSDAWDMAKNIGNTAMRGIPTAINQGVSHPGTALKNLGIGLTSIPFSGINALINAPEYLVGLESKTAGDWLKKYTPQVPVEDIVNANFGAPASQADADVRGLGAILPIGPPLARGLAKVAVPATKLAGKAALTVADKATLGLGSKLVGKTDAALEANEALLGENIGQKAAEVEQKTAAAQAADEANKQAISQSKQEVGKSDADLMQYNVTNRQKAIDELTQQNAALKSQLSEVQPKEGAVDEAQSKVLAKQEAQLKALQDAEANDAAYSAAIEQSKQQTGKSNVDLMKNAAQKRQADIDNLMSEATSLQEQLTNTKVGEDAVPQAEETMNAAQAHQQNTENMASSIESNIGQFLNEGAQHDVRGAQQLSNRVNSIEDYWNNAYKTFTNNIADANFHMPKQAMNKLDYDTMSEKQLIQTFGPDAFDALKRGKMDEFIQKQKQSDAKQAAGNNPYLSTLMEVAPTITDTNAADFLAKYKDFRDRTFKLSQRLRDPRVEELEKQKMQAALTQARQMQAQMKEVLDTGLGEFKPEFERVNKGYSEQVYPLRNNPVVFSSSLVDVSLSFLRNSFNSFSACIFCFNEMFLRCAVSCKFLICAFNLGISAACLLISSDKSLIFFSIFSASFWLF